MKQVSQFLSSWTGAIIMILALLAIRFGAPLITISDKANEVVQVQASSQPGYESWPAYKNISASWNKAWNDAKESGLHNFLKVMSIIFCFSPLLLVVMFDGSNSKNGPAWGVFFMLISVTVPPYIKPTALKNSEQYQRKFCEKEYEANKATGFDSFFPDKTESTTSLDQFLKSCK